MGLPQIGLEAIYKDAGFQRGIEQFNSGISKATTNAERGASAISRIGSIASGALTIGIGAAVTAFGALTAASKIGLDATLQWGEGLDKLGDMFGMSGEKASAFQFLANKVGLSVDEMGFGLNTLTRGLQDSADAMKDPKAKATPFMQALQKLGISAINSKGKLKSFDEILPQIMDAFKKLPPSINKSDLAMTLFGARGGSKFLDFLSAGSEGLTDATKKVKELGLELNTTQANAIEDFGFATNELKLGLTGLWNTIGIQVLPIARQFVDFINTRIIPAFAQLVREYAPRIIKAFQDFGGVLQRDVLPIISRAWTAIEGFVKAFQTGGISGFFDELGRQLGNAFKGFDLAKSLGDIGSALVTALQTNWPAIKTELEKWGGRFWEWLVGVNGKGGVLGEAATQLGKVKDAIVDWATKNGPSFAAAFEAWKTQFWNWLTDAKNGVLVNVAISMEKLTEAIRLWTQDPKTMEQLQAIGERIANTIIDGIGNLFSSAPGQARSDSTMSRLAWSLYRASVNLTESFKNIGASIAVGIADAIGARLLSPDVVQSLYTRLRDLMYAAVRLFIFQDAGDLSRLITNAFAKPNLSGFGSNPTTGTIPGGNATQWGGTGEKFADGGPVTRTGMAFVHAGEFVLNRAQVMQLAPVLAGANNSRTFNFTHNWPASVPASDRQWTEQMVRTVTHQEIINVLGNS